MALFGYGALGSAIGDFLIRAGAPKIVVIDKDSIEPHNIARHVAFKGDIGQPKTAVLVQSAGEATYNPREIECVTYNKDVLSLSDVELGTVVQGCALLIDATADERVRRNLSQRALPSDVRVARFEIFNRGRLGVAYLTGSGNTPNLVDLYYQLISKSLINDAISEWLRGEARAGVVPDELLLGIGCASASVRMPKHMIAQHASAFMPKILSAAGSGISAGAGINPLSAEGFPVGWQWFDVGGVVVSEPQTSSGWQVRIAQAAVAKLDGLREQYGANETGGYLYGGIDFNLRHIYVIEVSDLPPESKQSSTSIVLGPAGRTPLERKIVRRSGGKLGLVGTWHSHPRSGPEMSSRDKQTMERFRPDDERKGIPTLLVVTSAHGLASHL